MSDRTCTVDACHRPSHHDLAVCPHCSWTLERDLGDVTALATELDLTLSRQTATGLRNGSRSAERPLPFSYGASEADFALRSALAAWVRELITLHRLTEAPAATIGAHAGWLLARHPALVAHPQAHEAVEEIGAAVRECWRAIDRKAERIYAGRCGHAYQGGPCLEELYALPGRASITCRTCGVMHTVEDRRRAMLDHLDGMLCTGAEIAKLGTYLGNLVDREKARGLVKVWAQRGQIVAHGVSMKGEPTYPFGEVLARLVSVQHHAREGA